MKIAFYISTIKGGGAARVMVNLANQFSQVGNDIVFITNFPSIHEYKLHEEIKRVNLENVESSESLIKKNIKRCKKLRNEIKREKVDILISFMGENNFRAIVATYGLKIRTIISVRNDPNREYPGKMMRFLAKLLYRMADGCVMQTEDAMNWFPKAIQCKSRIIMNQVEESFFEVTRVINSQGIVAMGRLSKQKNHRMLIEEYAKISKKCEDDLYIYGEGELQDELIQLTQALNVANRVHFCGFTEDVKSVYSKAKIFVMTSDYEGMPNALLEAMATGVPCISTNCPCGGPKALIKNHENGVLIPLGDNQSLCSELYELVNNESVRDLYSRKARETAKNYHPQIVFEKWNSYLLDMLDIKIP